MIPPPSSSSASEPGLPTELEFPAGSEAMDWTGERFVSRLGGEIRLEHHHRYLAAAPLCAGRDVLDIASGEGFGSALLSCVAESVVGVDRDPEAVSFAARNYRAGTGTLRFEVGDCAAIPLPDDSVDVVVSFETIEHIDDHTRFLGEVRRVLRPGGLLLCSTPDRDVYRSGEEPNEFHQRELNEAEFGALLRGAFGRVEMLGQRIMAGSWLLPLRPRAPGKLHIFTTDDGLKYACSQGVPDPVYLFAVCTDGPMPEFGPSGLAHEGMRPREIERLAGRLRAEEARSAAARAKADAAAEALNKQTAEVKRLTRQAEARSLDLERARSAAEENARAADAARKQARASEAEAGRLGEQLRRANVEREAAALAARRELGSAQRQLELALQRERRLLTQRDEARTDAAGSDRKAARIARELELAVGRERDLLAQRDEARAEARRAGLENTRIVERLDAAAERERRLTGLLDDARRAASQANNELRTLRASRSWRVTAPLRAVGRLFRRTPRSPGRP